MNVYSVVLHRDGKDRGLANVVAHNARRACELLRKWMLENLDVRVYGANWTLSASASTNVDPKPGGDERVVDVYCEPLPPTRPIPVPSLN